MRDNTIIQAFKEAHDRMSIMERKLGGVYKVLEEIIGKELLRGQALHKTLMDKGVFTDAELKTALETIIAEGKADMQAMEAKAKAEKEKIVDLLVPQGANLTPPVEGTVPPNAEQPL